MPPHEAAQALSRRLSFGVTDHRNDRRVSGVPQDGRSVGRRWNTSLVDTRDRSPAQIASSLRKCVRAAQRLGAAHEWRPALESPSSRTWQTASRKWQSVAEVLATTVAEAEVHALALIQSGLEHADVVGLSVTRGLAYTPHTVARTAEEHLLRALHYLDTNRVHDLGSQEDLVATAEIRFNQLLVDLTESARLIGGLTDSPWANAVDKATDVEQWNDLEQRTKVLGWSISRGNGAKLTHTEGRRSSMRLAADYLSGPTGAALNGAVITQLIARSRGSVAHGFETGLFRSTRVEPRGDLPFAALVLEPQQADVGTLAFHLMTIPMCVGNAVGALATRFGWRHGQAFDLYRHAREKMITTWYGVVNRENPE